MRPLQINSCQLIDFLFYISSGNRGEKDLKQIGMSYKYISLSARIAVFNAFFESCGLLWNLTILTEVFVVKALMLYKFPIMNGLHESFMSRVLLLVNLGFIFLSQIPRLHLGGLYESYEFQIISGELFSSP